MRFLRFLIMKTGSRASTEEPEPLSIGRVNVTAQTLPGSADGTILLVALLRVESALESDADGLIVVPKEECRTAEEALVWYADIFSVTRRTKRELISPLPYLAFEAESNQEKEFLDRAVGIACQLRSVPMLLPGLGTDIETVRRLYDRLEGVAFVANAQSQESASGAFREYMRCFEAAFDTDKMVQLRRDLSAFLCGGVFFGYDDAEVRTWLDGHRHALVHSRGKHGRASELDILPIIQRVEQAAYDVLLNKADWRTSSGIRREVWSPNFGTADSDGALFVTQGEAAEIAMQLVDTTAGFPIYLGPRLQVPPPLFTKMSNATRGASGKFIVRERRTSPYHIHDAKSIESGIGTLPRSDPE